MNAKLLKVVRFGRRWLWVASPVILLLNAGLALANAPQFIITADFGDIDEVHTTPHKGIDVALANGTPVKALMEGDVHIQDDGNRSWGKSVHIKDGNGKELILGHLSKFKVHEGQHVRIGDTVGLSGNTGHSTGPHLHIQVNINGTPVNPRGTLLAAIIKTSLVKGE